MPDAFGNPTPQEVLASIRLEQSEKLRAGLSSDSPGVQLGAALGALFGPSIRKTLDTRKARKVETARLMNTQGLDRETAEQRAKETIGREFAPVRQAQRIQEAGSEMADFMDSLDASLPFDLRQAQGMLFMSNKLRNMGMITQANNLSAQAGQLMQAAEMNQLRKEKLEADLDQTRVSTTEARRRTDFIGTTSFQQNVIRKEEITGILNDPQSRLSAGERDSLIRERGHLEAKILKDETIIGRTESDVRDDPVLLRKLFNDLSDSESLIASLNDADAALADLSTFEATFWASIGKDALGFMEEFLGRKPDESEQEFIDRVTAKEGMPTLIAAKIRHALTGAQMSAFEIVFLEPFLPGPDDSVSQVRSKMNVIRRYTTLDRDIRMRLFQQGLTERFLLLGANLPKPSAQAPIDTPPAEVSAEAAEAAGDLTNQVIKMFPGGN